VRRCWFHSAAAAAAWRLKQGFHGKMGDFPWDLTNLTIENCGLIGSRLGFND
jgi:hypothetical protein